MCTAAHFEAAAQAPGPKRAWPLDKTIVNTKSDENFDTISKTHAFNWTLDDEVSLVGECFWLSIAFEDSFF